MNESFCTFSGVHHWKKMAITLSNTAMAIEISDAGSCPVTYDNVRGTYLKCLMKRFSE